MKIDSQIDKLIRLEEKRQFNQLEMIASENYASKAVREALGSTLTNKYSEGYPHKRYYAGNRYVDEIEEIAIERAKKLFGAEHANVQPYSGSPANHAVYFALCQPNDSIMGLKLTHGGHLTHGWHVNFSAKYYQSFQYELDPKTGRVDLDGVLKIAKKVSPRLIWAGATAYPRFWDFEGFRKICDQVSAYFAVDMAHFAGLVAGDVHPSPIKYADVVTTTTHKTLRGPRGAIIFCKAELKDKIDKAVFPELQGGPHDNTTAAIAICLAEAETAEFKRYAVQTVKNAKILAQILLDAGFDLVTGGTDNHLVLLDLGPNGISGKEAQDVLESVGIVVNKNTVPNDSRSPFVTSGLRIGTPAITTRGMKDKETELIANLIVDTLKNHNNQNKLNSISKEVQDLTKKFPIP